MVYLWLAVASGFCVAGIDGIPQQAIVQDMMQAIEWFKKKLYNATTMGEKLLYYYH